MTRQTACFLTSLALALICLFISLPSLALAQVPGAPWQGVDDFGRVTASEGQVPATRPDKTVGLFYFLWTDSTQGDIPVDTKNRHVDKPGPYDLTQILGKDPDPVQKDELLGKNGEMHYWGEPLFGYYDSRDPWVVRRHMQLIADAGVDTLVFDVTNLQTYPHVYLPLCDILLEMRAAGYAAPQVTFMTNTRMKENVDALWNDFYSQERYASLFFQWEGKPLLLANRTEVSEELRDKFTFRTAYWPTNGRKNTHNEWQWVAAYPQTYSWAVDENTPEEVNVSTAQNLARDAEAAPVWMSMLTARGRSFVWGAERQQDAPDLGLNFAQQWERAFELDPPFVMITGWNEWIAGRWRVSYYNPETRRGEMVYAFIDQYNYEYSRDVEPNRSSKHVDAYYLQMVDGIRKYKGASPLPAPTPRKSIDLDAGFEQWDTVEPSLRDYVGETAPRDFTGVGGAYYANRSGRNDIVVCKATRDAEQVYIYVETRDPITPTPPDGLCVAFDSDDDLTTGWRGADLLVGRSYSADGTVSAEIFDETTKETLSWSTGATFDGARWAVEGTKLQLSIPVGFFAGADPQRVSFKALDAVPLDSPADLYDQGDVAPESSFFYRVKFL